MRITAVTNKRNLVNLTPLIDVVFILLIFFMLVTNFTRHAGITLNVAQEEDVVDLQQTSSLIKISAAGTLYFNQQETDLEQLVGLVKENLSNNAKHIFFIQPADDLPLQNTILVLDELIPVASKNISFLRDEGMDSP